MTSVRYRVVAGFVHPTELRALDALARALGESAWEPGRQGTGYHKHALRDAMPGELVPLLDRSRAALEVDIIDWDCFLLRYERGAFVPPHTDPTEPHRHLRLNALLAAGGAGGTFSADGAHVDLAVGDAVIFRSDLVEHAVTPVTQTRYVWSVGCIY